MAENRTLLEAFAFTLLENEVLEREDIERLVARLQGSEPVPLNGAPAEPGPGRRRRCRGRAGRRVANLRPVFGRIDHIGVAVEDLDEAVSLYRSGSACRCEHRETVEEQGVEAVLLGRRREPRRAAAARSAPDTAVGRFLERNGPGMHHVAYGTDDIDAALEARARRGCA